MKRVPLVLCGMLLGGVVATFAGRQVLQGQAPVAPAPVIPKELTSYRDIVKKVLPGVVSVESRAKACDRVELRERVTVFATRFLDEAEKYVRF